MYAKTYIYKTFLSAFFPVHISVQEIRVQVTVSKYIRMFQDFFTEPFPF